MTTDPEIDSPKQQLGRKHWLLQVIPPCLMLSVLFATGNGTSLVFISGIFVLPVLISLISIPIKLIRFKQRKYFLIRPILTIAFFILILVIANWTYSIALDHAIKEAKLIHEQCNQQLICPENPAGWEVRESRRVKSDLGFWQKYTASFSYDENSFNIRVYQGPDLGEVIKGGVNVPFIVERYQEN